jgi:dolichyl-diphosphooligosaccharide--protein glycosyltransferase
VLVNDGFYVSLTGSHHNVDIDILLQEFWNWFDPTAWYPLGRCVGGTIYPGLMVTAGIIWNFLRAINMPVDIRNVCVMIAPAFSGLTAISTYL